MTTPQIDETTRLEKHIAILSELILDDISFAQSVGITIYHASQNSFRYSVWDSVARHVLRLVWDYEVVKSGSKLIVIITGKRQEHNETVDTMMDNIDDGFPTW